MGKGDAVTSRFGVLSDWAKLRFAVRTGLTRVKTASVQVTLNGDTLPSQLNGILGCWFRFGAAFLSVSIGQVFWQLHAEQGKCL